MHKQHSTTKHLSRAALATATFLAAAAGAAPLVSADWLSSRTGDDNLVVVDLRQGEDYSAGHIPGALNAAYGKFGWRTTVDGVVGMLPPVAQINSLIGSLGITPDKQVVVVPYGKNSSDVGAAARVYWTFRVLGHDNVSLLDGGQQAWNSQDLYLLERPANVPVPAADYPGKVDATLLIDTVALLEQVESGAVQPVDARTDEQWNGEKKHPKARTAGAIPTAQRLPQADLIDPATGKFVGKRQIVTVARNNGWSLDGSKPLVSYCNTGHWAATAWFALSEVAGVPGVKLYDGSMVAWTGIESNPLINTPSRAEQIINTITGKS